MDRRTMQLIEASGLFSCIDDEPYFSWVGCEHPDCPEKGKGANVYDMTGYRTLQEANQGEEHVFEFQVCGDCLQRMTYGEE